MTHNYLNEETETINLGRMTASSILLLVDATFFTQNITNIQTNKQLLDIGTPTTPIQLIPTLMSLPGWNQTSHYLVLLRAGSGSWDASSG